MEEKNIALCILGVIAIIAVVGLVLLFSAKTGATVAAGKPYNYMYPGGVVRTAQEQPAYQPRTGIWRYSTSSGDPKVEPAKFAYPPMPVQQVE
ncbi:hypothetical protein GF343_00995 [Candidatus Woesearchaeota archaeon]|nr:hypothetical protein [Candidatus Woesearchaeota archaeon]